MDTKPDHNILEIGCGSGLLAKLIAAKLRRGKFIGIDRSVQMIATPGNEMPTISLIENRLLLSQILGRPGFRLGRSTASSLSM